MNHRKFSLTSHHDYKRANGQYFTTANPFDCLPFNAWGNRAGLPKEPVLEPFAGANYLIHHLLDLDKVKKWSSFDIEPRASGVVKRDTIMDFPKGFNVCVTNPPWLAKNIASFRGLPFPNTEYDDLYKLALTTCLENCGYVAALVPESFIRSNLHQERLHTFISLTSSIFADTKHPVGLALFEPHPVRDVIIYSGKQKVGLLSELEKQRPSSAQAFKIRFNDPDGNLGLIALDNTKEASIRFCDVNELKNYKVKNTGRHITKVSVPWKVNIADCNKILSNFREKTKDVLMTCYRGVRKDGMYRRRLDWDLARGFLSYAN